MYKFLENNQKNPIWRDFDLWNEAISRSLLQSSDTYLSSYPPLNVFTREDEVLVQAFIPGVGLDDLEISVKENILTIKGKKKETDLSEGTEVHIREIFSGEFNRSLEFPFRVDSEKISADLKNGILSILIPKREEDKPKRIKVNSN